VGRAVEELQWDLDYLLLVWEAITKAAETSAAPFLVYQESDIIIRALRDYYRPGVGEILIDDPTTFQKAQDFMQQVMPNALRKLKLYEDNLPLFNRFQIESQIETAFEREVRLPSGGSIVVDHTEALISIDVNSARATKGADIEETALMTNLEAAEEVARQLRIRDLGGLIVIDFIDMAAQRNQREIENRLREALKIDRARVQIGRISRFGLLEMSRQRLRPSLGEAHQIVCPRCTGHGTIRDIKSLGLAVLRLLEEEAMKENTKRVVAKLPVEVATYLLNEKRAWITGIEQRNQVHAVIVPEPNLETPHFQVERVRLSEAEQHESTVKSSFELIQTEETAYELDDAESKTIPEKAAVQTVRPSRPIPVVEAKPAAEVTDRPGLLRRMLKALVGTPAEPAPEETPSPKAERPRTGTASRGQGSQRRRPRRTQSARQGGPRQGGERRTKPAATSAKGPQGESETGRSGGEKTRETRKTGSDKAPETKPETRAGAEADQGEGRAQADGQKSGRSRRGRRGGRGRRRRSPESQPDTASGSAEQATAAAGASTDNDPKKDGGKGGEGSSGPSSAAASPTEAGAAQGSRSASSGESKGQPTRSDREDAPARSEGDGETRQPRAQDRSADAEGQTPASQAQDPEAGQHSEDRAGSDSGSEEGKTRSAESSHA
jgi:ribonuclease E